MNRYDVIVLGVGGVGSAAAMHLAQRGVRVLGLDRFPPGHDRGSSHGHTRIIRKAYFEHPDYVPLLERAYQLWYELQEGAGEQLFFPVGLIEIGPSDGVVIPGVLESARRHRLRIDTLTPRDVAERFPQFHLPQHAAAVFERDAGYLLVERCVMQHAAAAERYGCELRCNETIVDWTATQRSVEVQTTRATYYADRLVITAGAWATSLLAELGVPLRILRKHLHWFACDDPRYLVERGCPGFFYEAPLGYYYGIPQIDPRGIKVAEHGGGTSIRDPLDDSRDVEPDELRRVRQFVTSYLPGAKPQTTDHTVCYYTVTPDEHFIVDRHPEYDRVVFSAGLSGHGFKFTSVLGEVMADLTLDHRTKQPIGFLRVDRFRP